MIGDSFEYNGRQYTIKRDVSFGEYKKISKLGNTLQKLTSEYELASEEDKLKIIEQFSKTTEDQLQLIGDFIESMLGLTQIDIDSMSLMGAISLFNEAFTISTGVKKKLETISESQSLQTTPKIQP
jgi:hypothetical protein